jgi:hypothetical protein
MNRQRDGILGIFDALGRLADAFSGADGASTSLLSKLAALNSVFSTIGGPIVQAVVGLAQFAAIMGALGEIVGVVGGLIGQALAGVPALLLAIGAAAGTVFLGLDGIKKAAEVMTPAFDKLKASISEVFVRQLTPAFRDLAAALPKLTDGFRFIAVALSGIAQQVIGFVTSARGIEVINGILRGTATLFSSMAPGIPPSCRACWRRAMSARRRSPNWARRSGRSWAASARCSPAWPGTAPSPGRCRAWPRPSPDWAR